MKITKILTKITKYSIICTLMFILFFSTINLKMNLIHLKSDTSGIELYYTGDNFKEDLFHLREDYLDCYSNIELTNGFDGFEHIAKCDPVDCEDFAFASKLLAQKYGYLCRYRYEFKFDITHLDTECIIDGRWKTIT